jgi:hypothetical protein
MDQDQNKNTQSQQEQDEPNTNRDPAEGAREQTRDEDMGSQERGTGSQGEKNSSGISNRGMSESEEQADLPSRGSSSPSSDDDSSGQSER